MSLTRGVTTTISVESGRIVISFPQPVEILDLTVPQAKELIAVLAAKVAAAEKGKS